MGYTAVYSAKRLVEKYYFQKNLKKPIFLLKQN